MTKYNFLECVTDSELVLIFFHFAKENHRFSRANPRDSLVLFIFYLLLLNVSFSQWVKHPYRMLVFMKCFSSHCGTFDYLVHGVLSHIKVYIMQKTILGQNRVNTKICFKHRISTHTKRTEQVKKMVFLQPPCLSYI